MQNNNNNNPEADGNSADYSSADMESEAFLPLDDGGSLATAQMLNDPHRNNPHHPHHHHGGRDGDENDATSVVHEMHLALLYLLSNPDEFQRALATRPIRGATTLHEWNAEYEDAESLAGETTATDMTNSMPDSTLSNAHNPHHRSTPLPFVVFADDAEVVLPAAHTASQLFGLEKVTGMELEAAAGVPALSQLFLRWLALMPGGDHLNLIDPPGLTVMRIAGGRYRVTAAHRVVWMWMNEFPNFLLHDSEESNYESSYLLQDDLSNNNTRSRGSNRSPIRGGGRSSNNNDYDQEGVLRPGDLVTLTIVDVFETDNQGKLLSYCPTFDNRMVLKTNAPTETLRKSTAHLAKLIGRAQKSTLAKKISFHATQIAMALRERVEEAVAGNKLSPMAARATPKFMTTSPSTTKSTSNDSTSNPVFEEKKESSSSNSQDSDGRKKNMSVVDPKLHEV